MKHRLPQLLLIIISAVLIGLVAWPVNAQLEEVQSPSIPVVQPEQQADGVDTNQSQTTQSNASLGNIEQITDAATTDTVALSAIPPRLGDDGSLTGDPGDVIQTQVKVRNNLNKRVVIEANVEDFIIGDDGKTPIPVTEETDSRWSLGSWISLPQKIHVLEPFATIDIPVIISVPADALAGGRYAMIMHHPTQIGNLSDEAQVLGGGAVISQRVGSLVYFQVSGEITENAAIRNLQVPSLLEFGPVPISFAIENLSDIHIQPQTTVEIHNMLGQKVEDIKLPSRNIFPYTLRPFEVEWDRVWGFGRYQVKIISGYGDQGKVALASQYFWIIPYTLLLAIAFAILALIGISIAVRRHLSHRNNIEQQHISLLEDRIRQLENELKDQ